jgi:hypothetical protein
MKQYEIDRLAIMWNKTKDEKYKEQWYKAVKLKSLALADNKTSRDNSLYLLPLALKKRSF